MRFFLNAAQRNKDMEGIKEKFKDLKCFSISPIRLLKEEEVRIVDKNTIRDKNIFFKITKGAM